MGAGGKNRWKKVIQTLDEAFAIFESHTNLERGFPLGNPNRVYRLDRMRGLCGHFGNPQEEFKKIHIAGSKGKGSTAAYMGELLAASGARIGIYSSPHLVDYRERFRIAGAEYPEELALETARQLLEGLADMNDKLPGAGEATTFELLTLFAFLLFRNTDCDYAVLETGLGGRLDATNVIEHPDAVLITNIERENTEILGDDISEIAGEKAGIIKDSSRVWTAKLPASAQNIIRLRIGETQSSLTELVERLVRIEKLPSSSNRIDEFAWKLRWRDSKTVSTAPATRRISAGEANPRAPASEKIRLSMGGYVQAENAALALLAARGLEPCLDFNGTKYAAGIAAIEQVSLPGRFQFLRENPPIVLDGAHTPRSIAAVYDGFAQLISRYTSDSPVLLFGSVAGKDHVSMARILCGGGSPIFGDIIVSTPGNFKLSDPRQVAESFVSQGANVKLILNVKEAWIATLKLADNKRPILITGSFYMIGEIASLNSDGQL